MINVSLNHNKVDFKRLSVIIVILVLIFLNVFQLIKYLEVQRKFREASISVESQRVNEKVLNFSKLFIKDVLQTKTEVDFEKRLVLETAVRDLKDEEILTQWNLFVNSKGETEAQENVKDLLEILVSRIKIVR